METVLSILWAVPEWPVELESGEVHLWAAELCQSSQFIERTWRTLADEERRRAERFSRQELRQRFVTGRGILRQLLGQYLRVEPAAVQLKYGPHEKPLLDMGPERDRLNFNVSHSGDLAVFGFAWDCPIGVDIEKLRPMPSAGRIVARYFSEKEKQNYQALAPADQEDAFFECFTRKEAFAKALGTGMATPFSSFDVNFCPGERARVTEIRQANEDAADWTLRPLAPAAGHIGAVAVRARAPLFKQFRYESPGTKNHSRLP